MSDINALERKKKIEAFLLKDKVWSAEILSCMDENIFPHIDAFFYFKEDEIKELALLIKKMDPVPLFINGSAGFCEKFLDLYMKELNHIHLECALELKDCFNKYFDWRRSFDMQVMSTNREHFCFGSSEAKPLLEEDVPEMVKLLSGYIDEKDIDIDNLKNGFYYGVKQDGKLVSMAGTHNVAFDYSIGTVGNVVTDKDFYGRGYAQQSLRAVISELSEKCSDIIIKVERDNTPALNLYKKMGFVHCKDYFEGFGLRRKK